MAFVKEWVELAREQKLAWVAATDRGDLPPTVLVERGGRVQAAVIAPEVDKHYAFQAAQICRQAFSADALVVILDAHVATARKGETSEEFSKRFPPGSMQRACDEEGLCETGEISDILICTRVALGGLIEMEGLGYSYHGKGTQFRWTEREGSVTPSGPDVRLEGHVPDALRRAMAQPSFLDHPEMQALSSSFRLSPERQLFHSGRAALRVLKMQGYRVCDMQEASPGWGPVAPL